MMPWQPRPACRTPRCSGRGPGYCERCQRERGYRSSQPTSRERGYSAKWDRVAREWLAERPWCGQQLDHGFTGATTECAKHGLRTRATVVNHKVSPRQGGDWFDAHNLESCCHSCNGKHAHEHGLFIADARPSRSFNREQVDDWG